MRVSLGSWQFWAFLSAAFAALTAVLARAGVENINSDLATFIRTIVVVGVLAALLTAFGEWQPPGSIPLRTYGLLAASGLATGASWLCYFRAMKLGNAAEVAAIDKLSVVFVAVIATAFLGERLSPVNWAGVVLMATGGALVALR